jgi:hypothetical protein
MNATLDKTGNDLGLPLPKFFRILYIRNPKIELVVSFTIYANAKFRQISQFVHERIHDSPVFNVTPSNIQKTIANCARNLGLGVVGLGVRQHKRMR